MEQEDYEQKEYKEDCVEEFFHVKHCIDAHVAPVLFSKLK
jgi:ubiquinol-cytochrome c reductase subunit 6